MPTSQKEDTEIVLGTGKILALFFALSAICAVFFGLGFLFGKNSARSADVTTVQSTPVTPAKPDLPKPSAHSDNTNAVSSPAAVSDPPKPPVTADASATDAAKPPVEQPATPTATNGYFVQIAAVTKQEDATALIDALKQKQYSAFLAENSPDKLFHVQVGPFTDVKDAEALRTRLLNDGYNPIIKR